MAKQRTIGEWVYLALVASMTVALGAAVVWYANWKVRPVVNDVARLFSCSESEWAVATDMPDDPAMLALAERFSERREPASECDPDDGSASTEFVFRTDIATAETLAAVRSEFESHGWRSGGRDFCFTKGTGEGQLWAGVAAARHEGGGSLFRVGMVNANYCAAYASYSVRAGGNRVER